MATRHLDLLDPSPQEIVRRLKRGMSRERLRRIGDVRVSGTTMTVTRYIRELERHGWLVYGERDDKLYHLK